MANVDSINGTVSVSALSGMPSRPPATASAELAKLEIQLSDWVNCPSCTTSAGKAKIAEISDKIQAIRAQVKNAEESSVAALPRNESQEPTSTSQQALRFDGLGALLNVQA